MELKYIHFEFQKEDHAHILSGLAFPALEELILEMTNISDAALVESAGRHSILKKLKLRNSRYVTVGGLRSFVQGGMDPEFVLTVKECPAISEEDLLSLSEIVRVDWN